GATPIPAAFPPSRGPEGGAPVRVDLRLRDREPDLRRRHPVPRGARLRRTHRVPDGVSVLPAPPRAARGFDHGDLRTASRPNRREGRPGRVQPTSPARLPPHRAPGDTGRSRLHSASQRAQLAHFRGDRVRGPVPRRVNDRGRYRRGPSRHLLLTLLYADDLRYYAHS